MCYPNQIGYEFLIFAKNSRFEPMNTTRLREIILEQSNRAHVGHIGSCLSIVEIVAALFGNVMNISSPEAPDRDRLVLSKGHAALAVYAALHLKGWLDEDTLNTFLGNLSYLGVHPEHHLRGIDFSTGSLGQGLSLGVGAAFAARLQRSDRRVFVILSDAELNEGATWEAVMFAGHHRLENLTVVVDLNGQQALDYTPNVINLNAVADKWSAFNWSVCSVDGHDVAALTHAVNSPDDKPKVVLANTTFGKGVSYMENQIKWHYWPMSDAEYTQALSELQQLSQTRL
jgi:transketolase